MNELCLLGKLIFSFYSFFVAVTLLCVLNFLSLNLWLCYSPHVKKLEEALKRKKKSITLKNNNRFIGRDVNCLKYHFRFILLEFHLFMASNYLQIGIRCIIGCVVIMIVFIMVFKSPMNFVVNILKCLKISLLIRFNVHFSFISDRLSFSLFSKIIKTLFLFLI